jgi:hypothetical protein
MGAVLMVSRPSTKRYIGVVGNFNKSICATKRCITIIFLILPLP